MSGNPLKITNSQLAEVEAYQQMMKDIFTKQFSKQQLPFPADYYTNLMLATKFSIARDFKEKDTIEMWRNWMKWFHEKKPYAISKDQEYITLLHNTGKYRFCGRDKENRPVMIIRMKFHQTGLVNVDQNTDYLLYMLEKGKKLAQNCKSTQICFIYDRREVAESDDVSKETMKNVSKALNDYYPEIVAHFLVLGANIFYRAMWKVISIFISKRTEEKIQLLEEVSQLTNFIDKENLTTEYGGMLDIDKDAVL